MCGKEVLGLWGVAVVAVQYLKNLVIGDVDWIELHPRVCDQNRVKFDLNNICILGVYDYYKTSPHMRLGYEEYKQ